MIVCDKYDHYDVFDTAHNSIVQRYATQVILSREVVILFYVQ